MAYGQTGIVHHAEHAHQALIFRTYQIAHCTTLVTELQGAGWAAVNTQFMLYAYRFYVVALAQAAVGIN